MLVYDDKNLQKSDKIEKKSILGFTHSSIFSKHVYLFVSIQTIKK